MRGANIKSTPFNITLEEVLGIISLLVLIILIVTVFVCCRRHRAKKARERQSNLIVDQSRNPNILKPHYTATADNEFKRASKQSNLEVSQVQAPLLAQQRPASYVSPNDPAHRQLNNFDTVRSYGSAADELEAMPLFPPERRQPCSIPPSLSPLPPSQSGSDTESLHKPMWNDLDLIKEEYYAPSKKIQNGKAMFPCHKKFFFNWLCMSDCDF